MSPFRQAVYAFGWGEFACQGVDVASGVVTFVRVGKEYPLQLAPLPGCTLSRSVAKSGLMANTKRSTSKTAKRPAAKSRTAPRKASRRV